MKGLIELFNIH